MKKRIGLYTAVWAILLALFNVIAFVPVFEGQEKYTASFWIGYVFITLMFIGQYICTLLAFHADDAKKMFYNVSLIKTSYAGLIASFIVGGICMFISPITYWIGVVVCAVIMAASAISVIMATGAIEEITRIDEKVKSETLFVKSLTVDADSLISSAKSDDAKEACKKVYEAIRYSDPMSNAALSAVEGNITVKFSEFSDAVKADDTAKAADIANELVILISDRNKKCMVLK